jgi:hypothetical protein
VGVVQADRHAAPQRRRREGARTGQEADRPRDGRAAGGREDPVTAMQGRDLAASTLDWKAPRIAPSQAPATTRAGKTTPCGASAVASEVPTAAGTAKPTSSPAAVASVQRERALVGAPAGTVALTARA